MNDSLAELASLYVFDQLDRAERAAFEARLLREPELAALVRDLEATLAREVQALPAREPSADLINRVEARIDALEGETASASLRIERGSAHPFSPRNRENPARSFRWTSVAGWGLAAVIALSLGTLAIQSLRHSPAASVVVVVGLDANRSIFAELPLSQVNPDSDARFIQLASLAETFWKKPADLPFKSARAPGDSRGYALFDPESQQGFIAIEQLPALAENQRYHLWVADALTGRVRDAGILPLAGMSRGLYSFAIDHADRSSSARPAFFVTVEEAGETSEPARPRGKVVLGDQGI